ncbi:hypothetical protein NBRC111894_2119 [Sporolactobacillus inulinus]|uniref:Uncharacterized protein n=1 Tax=Sporolactobacillus inulinus TaxID=2078 RepID=A0A4Y1ZBY4_9BACL|nr:hypothetical protein NBRC111894_2119 [Sporolactobacillus inulinus]
MPTGSRLVDAYQRDPADSCLPEEARGAPRSRPVDASTRSDDSPPFNTTVPTASWLINFTNWLINHENWSINGANWLINHEKWLINVSNWSINHEKWSINRTKQLMIQPDVTPGSD